uniref:Uncharacterized protein n=1 Tax=Anguilla anguilla TaxID=7936 RepID=A0A0E9VFG7_ANGAN
MSSALYSSTNSALWCLKSSRFPIGGRY